MDPQGFLAALEQALMARDATAFYFAHGPISGYACDGLTIAVEGLKGCVEVLPTSIQDGVRSYVDFPGPGTPHYELHVIGPRGEWLQQLVTCDLARAVDLVDAWRTLGTAPRQPRHAIPFSADERAYLAARVAAAPVDVVTLDDTATAQLSTDSAAQLATDLARLDPTVLARHYPRDDDGRLPLCEAVLLASYDSDVRQGEGRRMWLAACSPDKRRERPCVTLRLASLIGDNHAHRWHEAPWLWTRGAAPPDPPADLAACLAALDAGEFSRAFARYGITLDDQVEAVLAGEALSLHDRKLAPAWQAFTRRQLWEAAPWRLGDAIARAQAARTLWASAKKGRKATRAPLRLVALPGQRHQSKASLALALDQRVVVEYTASNERLAEIDWKRDLSP
jgi:hypothetical protein